MKNFISKKLVELAEKLNKPLYIVGGFCRNFLINGKPSGDIDLCAPLKPEELIPYIKENFSSFAVYENTGTIKFSNENEEYEFTSFRKENYPQGVTAMLSFNPDGSEEENVEAMTEALATVDTMQITYAARNSDFDGYEIHEGDYLGIYGSSLFGTSRDIKVLLRSLAEKVRDEGKEYITLYYGADINEKQAQKAADLFAEVCPDADVNLLNGGQPVYYYLISAE